MSEPLQLKAYSNLVDQALDQLLPSPEKPPSDLHGAMRYSCLAPGKRLRPALCMASAEAMGVDASSVLQAACSLEMVHCFSLIHDDLPAIDDDDLRRGMPTLHKKVGEGLAILAGDALFALAFQCLGASPHHPEVVLKCMQILTRASGSEGLVGGEVADILSEGKPVDPETLEFIHRRKTGALIGASCEIGAYLAGANGSQARMLRTYGEWLGLAFQIADDLLSETSSPEQLGKATGNDRARSKATYPALYGLDSSRRMAKDAVDSAIECLSDLGIDSGLLTELARFSIERVS